jgi:hypothetical protein
MMLSRLKQLFAILLVAPAIGLICQPVSAQSQTWQHPGVLVSEAQLDFIKQQVNLKAQPFYQEFLNAQKSEYGSLTYTPKGPYPGGVNQCGSYSSPDNGCQSADDDSAAAYVQALLWYITGNQTYANNAIAILNAYGNGLKGYAGSTPGYPCPGAADTCSNGPLQAAWDATKWPRAAEIIRYGNGGSAGWGASDIEAFKSMLTMYENIIYSGSSDNGNWELSMIEGMMGIAVFNEDPTLLGHAQLFWNQRVPAYFYDFAFDNPLYPGSHWPFPERSGPTGTTWNGQLDFEANTTGVAQETCRDLKHTEDGIASAIDAAETDYIQSQGGGYGVNLYTNTSIDAENRLVASLNLMAGLESKASTTAPTDFCTGASNKIELGIGTTYVIGYNEYHNRLNDPNMADGTGTSGLLGTSNTYTWIQKGLLPQSLVSDGGVHMAIFEPLTHYANAPPLAPNFYLSAAPSPQSVVAGSSATYTITVSASDGYSGNVSLSVSNGLPSGATASFSQASVSGSGTSTLTVTTGATTAAGSYTLQISGTDGKLTNNTAAVLTLTSPTTMTITVTDQTMSYGEAVPTPKYTKSPSLSLSTDPTCSSGATSTSTPGVYPITCSGAVRSGYTFIYVPGTLTINPAVVTITAKNQHMKPGASLPTLTYEIKPSNTILSTNPTCTTTATSSSPANPYPITCSGAEGVGDSFTYVNGTLTIEN